MTTERATTWSLTQQVESEEEAQTFMAQQTPPGWRLEGQVERAPTTGKLHLQLLLKTPQVRFSQVKKQFASAHIEVARDAKALARYVHKDETRVSGVEHRATPTVWDFNLLIVDKWDCDEFQLRASLKNWEDASTSQVMIYVDYIIGTLIEDGVRGAEYMGVNPMIRSAWQRYWKNMLYRKIYKEMRA